jgi:hypothetical protein
VVTTDPHPIRTVDWAVRGTLSIINRWHTFRVPLEIFLVGPLLALAVLAIIAVAADVTTLRPPRREPEEFGLLRPVALAADLPAARALRSRLTSLGIRATVGTGKDGFVRVLVFAHEFERARDAV